MQRAGAAWIAAFFITMLSTASALAAAPSAVLTGPSTAETGSPVAFDGTASADADGQALTYAWSIDGEDVGVPHDWLSVSFAHPGTHVVTLTVTAADGTTATASRRVAVTGLDRSVSSLHPLAPVLPAAAATPQLVLRPVTARARVRRHRLRIELRCRRAAVCTGTVRAVALVGRLQRPRLLAQRRFTIRRGGPRIVHVKLGPRSLRRLQRHRLVRVTAYRGSVRVASTWATYAFHVPAVRRARR